MILGCFTWCPCTFCRKTSFFLWQVQQVGWFIGGSKLRASGLFPKGWWKTFLYKICGIVFCRHLVKKARSIFANVSPYLLVLKLWTFIFDGSLVENTRFGSLALQFSRKSLHVLCLFWKSEPSVPVEALQKIMLVFEVGIFVFGGSLAQNTHSWRSAQLRYRSHCASSRNVTTVAACRSAVKIWPLSSFRECYCCHGFKCYCRRRSKNVTAVLSPIPECCRSRRFKNVSPFKTAPRLLYRSRHATAVAASRLFPQSLLQECDRGHV